MGAESYKSMAAYQEDVSQALDDLQKQVFESGDYRFSEVANASSIDEAREFAAEDGTQSVLDIYGISDVPEVAHAAKVSDEELIAWFGTTQVDEHEVVKVDECIELWESLGRGEARYLILYKDGVPSQYYFAGMSFD